MKFIRKHTEGPFEIQEYEFFSEILDKDKNLIAHIFLNKSDAETMHVFDKMLDYLIERAKLLAEQTQFNDSQFDDGWKPRKQELSRILEIIRAAGVEVIDD